MRPFKEKKLVKALTPMEEGLKPHMYSYPFFPFLNKALFYEPRQIENYNEETGQLLKALINNEALSKMND